MPMGDFFEEQFRFADVFNLLRLNDAEIGLFTGLLIVNPGTALFELQEHSEWKMFISKSWRSMKIKKFELKRTERRLWPYL